MPQDQIDEILTEIRQLLIEPNMPAPRLQEALRSVIDSHPEPLRSQVLTRLNTVTAVAGLKNAVTNLDLSGIGEPNR